MEIIRTDRLELVPLSAAFVEALKRGDRTGAERQIGASVSRWLAIEHDHFVQLQLAQLAADAFGLTGTGRAIIIVGPTGRRRVIGSIGFHGPPDEGGRLEIGFSIDPAVRRRGCAAEAMRALVEWAVSRYGITRFIVSIPTVGPPSGRLPAAIGVSSLESRDDDLDDLGLALDGRASTAKADASG